MELKGKVNHKLAIETGTSAAGNEWKKQTFVIETLDEKYPKKVAFSAFGKAVEYSDKLKLNDNVTVHFDLDSREYNGKWYTNVNAWKIEIEGSKKEEASEQKDDLPF